MRKGDFPGALRAYASASAARPSADLALRAYAARSASGDADPQEPLREWLKRVPDDLRIRTALAEDLTSKGDRAAAAREYQTILKMSPDNLVALNNLANLKIEENDAKTAVQLAERAYRQGQHMAQVADTYGWALVRAKRSSEGLPLLRTAYEKLPKDDEVRFHLAVALLESGQRDDARKHLEALASEQSPQAVRARDLLQSIDAPKS